MGQGKLLAFPPSKSELTQNVVQIFLMYLCNFRTRVVQRVSSRSDKSNFAIHERYEILGIPIPLDIQKCFYTYLTNAEGSLATKVRSSAIPISRGDPFLAIISLSGLFLSNTTKPHVPGPGERLSTACPTILRPWS